MNVFTVCITVCWDVDYDFSDYGFEGEGIIHVCHYANCGSEIEYYVRCGNEGDTDES